MFNELMIAIMKKKNYIQPVMAVQTVIRAQNLMGASNPWKPTIDEADNTIPQY